MSENETAAIAWHAARFGGEDGVAGGMRLFSVHFGLTRQDRMWSLSTTLPIQGPLIGQVHATSDDAKAAAEKMLAHFVARLTTAATQPAGDERKAGK